MNNKQTPDEGLLLEEKDIVEKCGLSPKTVKLLKNMSEKTYKEVATEIIYLANPVIEKQERAKVEALFGDGVTLIYFRRKRDNKANIEECYLIIKSEWEALKGEK